MTKKSLTCIKTTHQGNSTRGLFVFKCIDDTVLVLYLQMNFLLQDHSERFHMANGLVVELQVLGAASIDLTGMVSISLWNRNSESLIRNRYRLFGTLCLLCVKKKIATKTWIILCVVFCCLFVFFTNEY